MRIAPLDHSSGYVRPERFFFDYTGELVVAQGQLTEGEYPRIEAPATPIEGTDLYGHVVQPGDRLVTPIGEGHNRGFKIEPLRIAGVMLVPNRTPETGVINTANTLIPLVGRSTDFNGLLDKTIANSLIETEAEAKRVAAKIGVGLQFLFMFEGSGLFRAYIEACFPSFVPTEEPSRRFTMAA